MPATQRWADSAAPGHPGHPERSPDPGRSPDPAHTADPSRRDIEETLASLERGLDALTTAEEQGRPWWRVVVSRVLPPVVAVGLVLMVWQAVVWSGVKPRYIFPSPGDAWSALAAQWGSGALQRGIWYSVSRGLLGFVASVVIGTPIGLLVARVRPIRTAFKPVLSGLQSLPSVAWGPAAILWFGLSPSTIYFVVLLGAIPSVAIGTASGVDQVPTLYLRVGRVLGARGLRTARYILLPAALPGYVGGLKQGWAFAWRSLMAAELITQSPDLGTGLGQLLDSGRQLSDISLVFGMILVILAVGIIIDQVFFSPLERRVLRRRGLLTGR